MKTVNKLWIAILVLAILSPLGLLLPEYFKSGQAWGEWGIGQINNLVGYTPQGINKLSGLWTAPLTDYNIGNGQEKGLLALSRDYIISACLGTAAVVILIFLIAKLLIRKND